MRGQFEQDLLSAGLAMGLVWMLGSASVILCGAFLALALLLRAVRGMSMPVQYALVVAAAAVATAAGIDRAVCRPLGFVGGWRALVDGIASLAIVATWAASRLRRSMTAGDRVASPIDLLLGTSRSMTLAAAGASLAVLVGILYVAAAISRRADWDFLLLESITTIAWIATAAFLFRAAPRRAVGNRAIVVACLVPLLVWQGSRAMDARSIDVRRTIDRYTIYNGSLRLADSVLERRSGAAPAFLRYLRENSGLTDVDVKPVSLDFVSPLAAAPRQPPPHLFLFVIDSLRPDYLSPYNAAVTFTPRIAELADDSVVFRNAVTRYGATGLSLPAIWTGAVGPHRQYVIPFWPMNTLEKLLAANAYRRIMSVDVLMEQLLKPWPDTVPLDRGRRTLDYDLCGTLAELESRFPPAGADDPPVFAYSNPQNLHLSNLMSASVPAGEAYPGFHAPYAARVRAIDRCLGRFVDFLKERHAYDRSLIVITSDHGELLGEEGRWGHAYYLFPQILGIPLIVHLPQSAQPPSLDRQAISFSTDISPTVYAALGYRPRPSNALMGESLVDADVARDRRRRRDDYVVEASYSAVYGVMRHNGTRLYIIDAMSGSEYAYQRKRGGAWTATPVDRSIREPAARVIREHIDAIRRVYRLPAYR